MRVLVLGATGMLGHMVACWLSKGCQGRYSVTGTYTGPLHRDLGDRMVSTGSVDEMKLFEYGVSSLESLIVDNAYAYVINCIGVIKPMIDESDIESVSNAISVNSLLPHELAKHTERSGSNVIQIATDCVYSGNINEKESYPFNAAHDCMDVYGRTKSLGEVMGQSHFKNIRCSIIGPEINEHNKSLYSWIKYQAAKEVSGWYSHKWNGVTTLAFAKVCDGIMRNSPSAFNAMSSCENLCPSDRTNKRDLLRAICMASGRGDIDVVDSISGAAVNRTLISTEATRRLWGYAGYHRAPSISELMIELARFVSA